MNIKKRLLFMLLSVLLFLELSTNKMQKIFVEQVFAEDEIMFTGDVNNDGSVTTADFVALVMSIINSTGNVDEQNYDINNDHAINVEDLILLKNIFLYDNTSSLKNIVADSQKYVDIFSTQKYFYSMYYPETDSSAYLFYNQGDVYMFIDQSDDMYAGAYYINGNQYVHYENLCWPYEELKGILEKYNYADFTEYIKSGDDYSLGDNTYKYDEYYSQKRDAYAKFILDEDNNLLGIDDNDKFVDIIQLELSTDESIDLFYSIFEKCMIVEDKDQFYNLYAKDIYNGLEEYIKALNKTLVNRQSPDGSYFDDKDVSNDSFAIFDVDKDGKNELLYRHASFTTASAMDIIYKCNENGKVVIQDVFGVNSEYYSNGIVKVKDSHNQGYSGRFWPYSIYKYNDKKDKYERIGYVEAWDKEQALSRTDMYTGKKVNFPYNVDKSGYGFVYYIDYNGYDPKNAVSQEVYNAWINSVISRYDEISYLKFYKLSKENIQNAIPLKSLIPKKPLLFKTLGLI